MSDFPVKDEYNFRYEGKINVNQKNNEQIFDSILSFYKNERYLVEEIKRPNRLQVRKYSSDNRYKRIIITFQKESNDSQVVVQIESNEKSIWNPTQILDQYTVNLLVKHLYRLGFITVNELNNHVDEQSKAYVNQINNSIIKGGSLTIMLICLVFLLTSSQVPPIPPILIIFTLGFMVLVFIIMKVADKWSSYFK